MTETETTSVTTAPIDTKTETASVTTAPIDTKTETTSVTSAPIDKVEMPDEARHKFLAYLMPQLEPLRQAVEHNWLIQAVLITLAAFNLYNPAMANSLASALKIPVDAFDAVIPLVLTYLFIRFGFLLNAYLFIRDGITETLKGFSVRPAVFQDEPAERMLSSNALVELFCLEYKRKRFKVTSAILGVLPFLVALIFALNHRLVFLYLDRLVGHRPTLLTFIKLFIAFVLGLCYLHFIATTKRTGARVVAVAAIVFTFILFKFMR